MPTDPELERNSDGSNELIRSLVRLSPLLLLYVAIVAVAYSFLGDELWGDEARYLSFAENLTSGYLTDRDPQALNLWNGPGYPLILAAFLKTGLPLFAARLLNAALLFVSVVLFRSTVRLFSGSRASDFAALIYGSYWPMYGYLPRLVTEPLVIALISALAYAICRYLRESRLLNRWLIGAAAVFAFLALTKVLFGYVIMVTTAASGVFALAYRRDTWRRMVLLGVVTLVFTAPYLTYTWSLTGRPIYWATSGGMSLYWMSTPYAGEFGDWHSSRDVRENPRLQANHGAVFAVTDSLGQVDADRYFVAKALDNISSHPTKYALNVIANVGRMTFSYPFSYAEDRLTTYFWLVPNMFVITALVLTSIPAWLGRKSIPAELLPPLMIAVIAFGGSSLLSAYTRHFYILAPVFGLWLSFIGTRLVRVDIRDE